MPTKLHEAARALAARGVPIFAIRPGTKWPAFKRSFYDSTTDLAKIDAWWSQQDYNIGICPEQAGWAVVDVDVKNGWLNGETTLTALEKQHGRLPETLTVRTPSGGRHLYFRGSLKASQGKSGLGPGLDTRGKDSYALAPPSQVSGVDYRVERAGDIAPLPEWIGTLLQHQSTPARTASENARIDSATAIDQARAFLAREPIPGPDGDGDDYLTFTRCKDLGVSEHTLLQLCISRGSHDADVDWLEVTIANAWKYGQNEPGSDYRDPAAKAAAHLPDQTYKRVIALDPRPVGELIPGLVERHRVAYLVGTGGMHKSRIAAHWGLAVHAGQPIYAKSVERAHFVHLSWENGIDEDARRTKAIIQKIGAPDDAAFGSALYYDLCDNPLPIARVSEGLVEPTDLWREIAAALDRLEGHKFVVFDSLYNALHFSGQAKIDEESVKRCINWLDQQCREHNFSGLMLQHPSRQGANQGHSGYSEAWNNAPRVRLTISQEKDSDTYKLEVSKRNNALAGGEIWLKWDNGILDMVSATATVEERVTRLQAAAEALAIRYAEAKHPIMLTSHYKKCKSRISDYDILAMGRELGRKPTAAQIVEACNKAMPERLVYHHEQDNRTYPAGFYPAPGPGGKGFD